MQSRYTPHAPCMAQIRSMRNNKECVDHQTHDHNAQAIDRQGQTCFAQHLSPPRPAFHLRTPGVSPTRARLDGTTVVFAPACAAGWAFLPGPVVGLVEGLLGRAKKDIIRVLGRPVACLDFEMVRLTGRSTSLRELPPSSWSELICARLWTTTARIGRHPVFAGRGQDIAKARSETCSHGSRTLCRHR